MQKKSEERARVSYEAFRAGFDISAASPAWDDLPPYVRDAVLVAYSQGKLDASAPLKKLAKAAKELVEYVRDNRMKHITEVHLIEASVRASVCGHKRQGRPYRSHSSMPSCPPLLPRKKYGSGWDK